MRHLAMCLGSLMCHFRHRNRQCLNLSATITKADAGLSRDAGVGTPGRSCLAGHRSALPGVRTAGRVGPRTNRQSWFGAWYERKCFRSRSEAEGGASLHRGFATPRWRIFAISLRDAADFAPDGVGPTSWTSLHVRRPSWSATKSGSRHARTMNVDWS